MVRNRKRKTNIGLTSEDTMLAALRTVLHGGWSIKRTAIRFSIARTTLTRYVNKYKGKDINWDTATVETFSKLVPNYGIRRVFTDEEESLLVNYFKQASQLHHGLPPRMARKLAYEFAEANHKKIPENWRRDQCAGEDFFALFLKRHKDISLRTPEATSLARAMGFNKPVVSAFYDNLIQVLSRHGIGPHQVFNVDETGVSTVQTPGKVIAPKGVKQIGQITSAERGELVSVCCCVNACGNTVPPLMIFPRVNFKTHMIHGAPPGTVGVAAISGWMNKDIFYTWLEHFISHTKPSKEAPVLLIMDNLKAHITYASTLLAKNNGVILLTFPPHTSHRLQPLDRTVYGPLKKYYNEVCRQWLLSNPGKRISIYEIAAIFGQAYQQAFSVKNILSGFSATGIFPVNRNIFEDSDFLAADVTDRPLVPTENEDAVADRSSPLAGPSGITTERTVTIADSMPLSQNGQTTPESKIRDPPRTPENNHENSSSKQESIITPAMICPLPKAVPSKSKSAKRKKAATKILTDTPNLNEIKDEEERSTSSRKKRKEGAEKVKRNISKTVKNFPTKTLDYDTDDSVDEDITLIDTDDDMDEDWCSETENEEQSLNLNTDQVEVNSFILVKYVKKKMARYFIGKVEKIVMSDYTVNFLRRKGDATYLFPENKDVDIIQKNDIVAHLPEPTPLGNTSRTQGLLQFNVNFVPYTIE